MFRELHKILSSFSASFNYEDEDYDQNTASNVYEMAFDHYGLPLISSLIERMWCESGSGDLPPKMLLSAE